MRTVRVLALLSLAVGVALADGPADNDPAKVKPIPPPGNAIPAEDRAEIATGLAELQQLIKDIGKHELLPDVRIFEKAVRWALDYNEIFDGKGKGAKPATNVKKALAAGLERAKQLKVGKTPWATATGPVLRGYQSKIDGDVQPYWLIVPKDYDFAGTATHRLDFWWHGRFETQMEATFMANSPGTGSGIIPAPGALILHPYGRFSNANKFAGEVDTFECLDHAKKHYRIDEDRLVARGFSMGGAACWQFAVHYPTLWAAAAPGAGFAETREFLKDFQGETVKPTWYQKKLWRMYDATEYSVNLFNLPTVAYSGEKDKQKQAADVMARALAKNGMALTHVIGEGAGHNYTAAGKKEVNEKIDAIVAAGRKPVPTAILFQTHTLRYNRSGWIEILGLKKHWDNATVVAEFVKPDTIRIKASNVSALRVNFEPGQFPFESLKYRFEPNPEWLGNGFKVPPIPTDKSYSVTFGKLPEGLSKVPGLQGPIDDAFMDSFVVVKPTGTPMNEKIGQWTQAEMTRAVKEWRRHFRGDAIVKADKDITEDDIKNSNLILWGDPKSNAILAKIADKLPLKEFGDTTTTICIYPNPLNPKKYVVLNSGFTYREYAYLNNARQVPMLPDYAVVDVTTPPDSRFPGEIVRAGFFDEQWKLQKDDGKIED